MTEVKNHALLSASSAHRWLACPPSARLSESYEDATSDFAAEGSDAHTLAEFKLRQSLGISSGPDPRPTLKFYDAEMDEYTSGYASYVLEIFNELKRQNRDPQILIEQRLDFCRFVPEGFGTGDAVIIAEGSVHVIDFKYGRGVYVDANHNSQMMLYGLGALELFDHLYEVEEVKMTIYQPRLGNVSTFSMPSAELRNWAETVLTKAAKLAYNGQGEFKCGEHCRFCKVRAECRERAKCNLDLAKLDFQEPALLSDAEIEEILVKADDLVRWANDVQTYALEQALRGKSWQNFKVVEGRANRRYANEDEVIKLVEAAGYDPYTRKLASIGDLEKRIGKVKVQNLIANLIVKPPGKPTLVPRSDKREELHSAVADFKNIEQEEN